MSPTFVDNDAKFDWRKFGYHARSAFAVLLSLVVLIGGGWFVYAKAKEAWTAMRAEEDFLGEGREEIVVVIPQNSSAATIGNILVENGVIKSADLDARAAFALWEATRLQREETYMASNRLAAGGIGRDTEDLESGGYDRVALAVMKALAFDEATDLIVNFRNGSRLPMLPADTVIEAPCRISAAGVTPLPVTSLPDHALGLVQSVKFAERSVIRAALNGSRDDAVAAFALHPLIDGVGVARRLLDAATARFPELSYLS